MLLEHGRELVGDRRALGVAPGAHLQGGGGVPLRLAGEEAELADDVPVRCLAPAALEAGAVDLAEAPPLVGAHLAHLRRDLRRAGETGELRGEGRLVRERPDRLPEGRVPRRGHLAGDVGSLVTAAAQDLLHRARGLGARPEARPESLGRRVVGGGQCRGDVVRVRLPRVDDREGEGHLDRRPGDETDVVTDDDGALAPTDGGERHGDVDPGVGGFDRLEVRHELVVEVLHGRRPGGRAAGARGLRRRRALRGGRRGRRTGAVVRPGAPPEHRGQREEPDQPTAHQ